MSAYISDSSRELLDLVNGLLDLAKAEAGATQPACVLTDLDELLAGVRATLRPLADGQELSLVVEAAEVDGPVCTDPALLVHVLRNLISNAIKFTASGEVRVSTRVTDAGQHVRISVTDTGIGIGPEDQIKIFEEFFQVAGPLQTRSRGTGLGLPLARQLVTSLGGQLLVESTVGEGSSFTVELPYQRSETAAQLTPTVTLGPDRIVLVVDDDPSFRHALRGLLQPIASRVIEVGDGLAALETLEHTRPDLVFLDLRMPGLGGADVLARMRANDHWSSIPVVVTTSIDLNNDVLESTSLATAVVPKSAISAGLLRAMIV